MKTLYQMLYDWKIGRALRKAEREAAGKWQIVKKSWVMDLRNLGVRECSFWKDDRRKIHFVHVKWWAYLWAMPYSKFIMEHTVRSGTYIGVKAKEHDLPPTSLRKTLKYCESMFRMEGEEGS